MQSHDLISFLDSSIGYGSIHACMMVWRYVQLGYESNDSNHLGIQVASKWWWDNELLDGVGSIDYGDTKCWRLNITVLPKVG